MSDNNDPRPPCDVCVWYGETTPSVDSIMVAGPKTRLQNTAKPTGWWNVCEKHKRIAIKADLAYRDELARKRRERYKHEPEPV